VTLTFIVEKLVKLITSRPNHSEVAELPAHKQFGDVECRRLVNRFDYNIITAHKRYSGIL